MQIQQAKRLKLLIYFALVAVSSVAFLLDEKRAQGRQVKKIDFNRDIKPILSDKCFACHGPDASNKKIRLRLDSEAGARAALGGDVRAVVPGHPEQSEMIRRITATDELEKMPPAYSGRSLTKNEIDLLTEWIRQGAEWQKHWAFIKPARPQIPGVKNAEWPKNGIDRFILERLEREGLNPSPEADREALIRRVTFDLTGLPPTLEEIDVFLADRSSNAYEKVVDRLLGSPRYGERMAFRWLEAARYADTNGYQLDGERSMWRWRDWVIEAFNSNKPFDQFTIEQLAGDLLPGATLDQKIATAFNRNHRGNSEDGIVPEEYAVEYVVDRVDTTSTVFLGVTMGCARCHNHKYDPLAQKEYYRFYAFFNNLPEDGRYPNHGNAPPYILAPTREQQQELAKLDGLIDQAKRSVDRNLLKSKTAQIQWEKSLKASIQLVYRDNLLLHHPLARSSSLKIDESVLERVKSAATTSQGEESGFREGSPKFVDSPIGQAVHFDGKIFFDAGKTADFDYRDRKTDFKSKFTISAWIYPESENSGAIVTRMRDEAVEKDNNLPKNKGYGLFFLNGKIHFNLVSVWADDSYRVETEETFPAGQWLHAIAVFDGTAPYEKVRIYVDGRERKLKINNHRLFRTFSDSSMNLRIGAGGGPEFRFRGAIGDVRIYNSLAEDDQVSILSCPESPEKIAGIPLSKRTEAQKLKIRRAWLEDAAPFEIRESWNKFKKLKKERGRLINDFPTLMVMQELKEPRPAFLLKRGAYDAPGERVSRGVPAVFPEMSAELPQNRLGLAKWIVHPENPLTARVTVNRFWQTLFGAGLVKTAEDFGSQGELPSHPELLDWLAVEFQSGGWDVKSFLKTILMSATYRQSSKITPQSLQRDPDNRLLARGPRHRLPAEMIRDQALFLAGLLIEKRGGPSVRPYQPDGLYKDLLFSNMTEYNRDKSEELWRRSLYTFWKRTVMPPAMGIFDASSREFCTVRETRTNTPLQALNLMNDVTYVEASRMLAQRMMLEGGPTRESRIEWAFRLATSRKPDHVERKILSDSFTAQLERFRRKPPEAAKLLAIGEKRNDARLDGPELAAYAVTASLILNLDEVITRQ